MAAVSQGKKVDSGAFRDAGFQSKIWRREMKLTKVLSVGATVLLAALSATAQGDKSTVTALEFQTPKNGMVQQYEAGRKAKAAWHKQQKDPQMLFVLQVLTGEHTRSYVVDRKSVV